MSEVGTCECLGEREIEKRKRMGKCESERELTGVNASSLVRESACLTGKLTERKCVLVLVRVLVLVLV